jgi:hypothetical protein
MIKHVHWIDLLAEAALEAESVEFCGHGVVRFHYAKRRDGVDASIVRCHVCGTIYGVLYGNGKDDDVLSACACSR